MVNLCSWGSFCFIPICTMSSVVALLWGALRAVHCHVKGKPLSHSPQSLEMGIPCQPSPCVSFSEAAVRFLGFFVCPNVSL